MVKGVETKDLIGEKVIVSALDASDAEITISSGKDAVVVFNRETGALMKESIYQKFRITQGNTNYIVVIEPTTGRISCEKE